MAAGALRDKALGAVSCVGAGIEREMLAGVGPDGGMAVGAGLSEGCGRTDAWALRVGLQECDAWVS